MKHRRLAGRGSLVGQAVANMLNTVAEESKQTAITTDDIVAWHGACKDELVAMGVPSKPATKLAMALFETQCVPKGSNKDQWPDAAATARAGKKAVDGA